MSAALDLHPAAAVGWISTAELARLLGRAKARAGRDWCRRHGVPLRRDGKHNFARLDHVRAAFEGLPLSSADDDDGRRDRIRAMVERTVGGAR